MTIDYFALIVSILSALIALVALLRAREANRIANEANRISVHYNLRPLRLEACNLVKDFATYCTKYSTMFVQRMVSGTNELMDQRDEFRARLQAFGPLKMPDIMDKATELSNHAVLLQRALDRTRGADPKPLDSKYATIEENIDAIVDWFAETEKLLPSVFKKYLDDA